MVKIMKKLATLLIIVSLSALSVQAQNMQNRGAMAPGLEQIVVTYGEELNLTDDQISEIISKQLEYQQTMRASRAQMNRGERGQRQNNDQRQARMGENLRGPHTQSILNGVLTDDQKSQLRSLMLDRTEFEHDYRTIKHQMIVEKAELSGDKADQVLSIMNKHSEMQRDMRIQGIENPSSVDADQRRELSETMQADREELRSILTVEEYQNLMQFMNHRQSRQNSGMNQRPNNRRQNR